MSETESIEIETAVLPLTELNRLLRGSHTDLPEVSVTEAVASERFIETAVAVAAISATTTLLLPFVKKLAERLFAAEPDASLTLEGEDREVEVVISAATPAGQRQDLIDRAFATGMSRIRIVSM